MIQSKSLTLGFAASQLLFAALAIGQEPRSDESRADDETVTITGSRIKRDSFDYPVPVAVVTGEALNDSGFTVLGEALVNLPQALTSTNIQSTSGTLFNAGQSRVDLRGLGSARTLVLVDGRRHLTGDFRTSAVDLNMIPSTMIDRIEAISGGASAVYGSEAIAGVVNIILRKDYDGIEFDFQGGLTEEEDGEEWKASFGYGLGFADERGQFIIGAEYGEVEPIYQIDRDWAFPGIRRNTAATPQTILPASRSTTMPTATFQLVGGNNAATARSVSIGLDRSQVFVNSADCRTAVVAPTCQDPHLFYTATYNVLQGGLERITARTYTHFDLTDNVRLFADLTYGKGDGEAIFQPSFSSSAGGGTMPVRLLGDNAFLNGPGPLAQQMRTEWVAAGLLLNNPMSGANVGKFWPEFGNRDSRIYRESYRAVSGVQGAFGLLNRNIDYEVFGQYSELDGYALAYNVPNIQRVQQATDAILDASGNVVCRDATARANGCAPWDLINGPSQAAVDWANANARSDGKASQTVAALNLTTGLFELPAGPLGFAIGGEYREEKSDQIQDPLSASGALFYNAIGRTKGEFDLTEAYAEMRIPILADLPFVHLLSIEAAGRVGDYSTVGSVEQWRLGAEWAPVQDLRFRGSSSVAVRAPNITELFAPQGRNFTTAANDPCDRAQVAGIPAGETARRATRIANCTAHIPGYDPATFVSNFGTGRPSLALLQGGNTELLEESADTYSVGFVARPRFLPSLQVSADYWDVKLDQAINTIPINTLLTNLCYDVDQSPAASNRFCDLVRRDPTGATTGGLLGGVSEVILTNQNVQSIETNGVDVAIAFDHDFGAIGRAQVRLDGTKIIRWDLQGVPGGPVTHFQGTLTGVAPEYKVLSTLGWSFRKLGMSWQSRYQSSLAASETLAPSALDPFYTGVYWEHDVRATYKVSDALKLRAGIINVTNETPPQLPESAAGTGGASSIYDNRGRWFYIGGNYVFD